VRRVARRQARSETRSDTRHETRDTRHETRDTRHERVQRVGGVHVEGQGAPVRQFGKDRAGLLEVGDCSSGSTPSQNCSLSLITNGLGRGHVQGNFLHVRSDHRDLRHVQVQVRRRTLRHAVIQQAPHVRQRVTGEENLLMGCRDYIHYIFTISYENLNCIQIMNVHIKCTNTMSNANANTRCCILVVVS